MLKIGVISDTHGLLRPEAERCLAGVGVACVIAAPVRQELRRSMQERQVHQDIAPRDVEMERRDAHD